MIYVLVSGAFEMIDTPHKADVFGQQLEMPDNLAKSAILDGACMLPKDAFDACGFNAEEIAQYPNARMQTDAPLAFRSKLTAAIKAVAEYRAKLAAPTVTATAAPKFNKEVTT